MACLFPYDRAAPGAEAMPGYITNTACALIERLAAMPEERLPPVLASAVPRLLRQVRIGLGGRRAWWGVGWGETAGRKAGLLGRVVW